jgi:hypothetical protein
MKKTPYVDEIDPNYRRFRQRLRKCLEKEDGHLLSCELRAPRNGFRFVTVHIKDRPPIQFYQPWEGERI